MLPFSGKELSNEKAENVIDKPEKIETFKWVFKIFGIPIFSLTRTLNGEELLYKRLEERLLTGIEKGLYDRVKTELLKDLETHLAKLMINAQRGRGK